MYFSLKWKMDSLSEDERSKHLTKLEKEEHRKRVCKLRENKEPT